MLFGLQALDSAQSSSPLWLGHELKENSQTLALLAASLRPFAFGVTSLGSEM